MALILIIWFLTMIGVHSCGVDSVTVHYLLNCESDYQCPDGYYCFMPSQICAKCVECDVYKRTSSWRQCPKVPAECGQCFTGYEEEILAEGSTRDFCVVSEYTSSQTDIVPSAYQNVQFTVSSHYFLILGLLSFIIPILFYAFCWKKWTQGHLHFQNASVPRDEPRDEPPPYQSIELTPISSTSDSLEVEENQTVVMNISYTKDRVTEAAPFRRPDYEEQENTVHNTEGPEGELEAEEIGVIPSGVIIGTLELEDEDTLPSDWTPDSVSQDSQLVTEQQTVVENVDGDSCQPRSKRRRNEPEDADTSTTNTTHQEQQQHQQQSISIVISNNIIIKKQDE